MTAQPERQEEEKGESWISIQRVAEELGIKPPAVWYYIKTRDIPTKKFDFDKKRYIPFAKFQEILAAREASKTGLREKA